jgi:hypothetical protein
MLLRIHSEEEGSKLLQNINKNINNSTISTRNFRVDCEGGGNKFF